MRPLRSTEGEGEGAPFTLSQARLLVGLGEDRNFDRRLTATIDAAVEYAETVLGRRLGESSRTDHYCGRSGVYLLSLRPVNAPVLRYEELSPPGALAVDSSGDQSAVRLSVMQAAWLEAQPDSSLSAPVSITYNSSLSSPAVELALQELVVSLFSHSPLSEEVNIAKRRASELLSQHRTMKGVF